jgi:hypothetical protein
MILKTRPTPLYPVRREIVHDLIMMAMMLNGRRRRVLRRAQPPPAGCGCVAEHDVPLLSSYPKNPYVCPPSFDHNRSLDLISVMVCRAGVVTCESQEVIKERKVKGKEIESSTAHSWPSWAFCSPPLKHVQLCGALPVLHVTRGTNPKGNVEARRRTLLGDRVGILLLAPRPTRVPRRTLVVLERVRVLLNESQRPRLAAGKRRRLLLPLLLRPRGRL